MIKEYKIPFDLNLEIDKGQEIKINNRFSGEVAIVPWFAAAVYDLIMGCEQFQDWKTHRQGLDWFARNFPKQYYDFTRLIMKIRTNNNGMKQLKDLGFKKKSRAFICMS
jgi:hypothetical protein